MTTKKEFKLPVKEYIASATFRVIVEAQHEFGAKVAFKKWIDSQRLRWMEDEKIELKELK